MIVLRCSQKLLKRLHVPAQPPTFTRNSNRSLVASMNQRKYEAWAQFAHNGITAFEVAVRMLETPFSRKDMGREFHFALDLLRGCLMPPEKINLPRL